MGRLSRQLGRNLIVAGLIFGAALFGILTRPVGFLAAFWPANALLLAIMVRHRAFCTPAGWGAAFLGYVAADLMTGGNWFVTLWLTGANLVGAGTGVLLFYQLTEEDRRLHRPLSVLYLFVIATIAGVAAALTGGGVATFLFEKDWLTGFGFWFTTELVNDLLLVPVVLTIPSVILWKEKIQETAKAFRSDLTTGAPLLALLGAIVITLVIGGPGAIAFTVPALLWCALTYSMFNTALLTFLTCSWTMIAVSAGLITILPVSTDLMSELMSIRLGVALLALGPLTAASINQTRNELVETLNHAVNHDFLTNALARRAFLQEGARLVTIPSPRITSPAVLMMDLDRFKQVNDQYGHAAGDEVLITFARTVAGVLRQDDLLGRLGGEEFAVVLPKTGYENARTIAERIRSEVEATVVHLSDGQTLKMTVSIGLACGISEASTTLQSLMMAADESLYRAKAGGRNRVDSVFLHA